MSSNNEELINQELEAALMLPTPQQLREYSKKELEALATQIAQQVVKDGWLNELEVYIRSKKLTDFANALASAIKDKALTAATREQEKGAFSKFGATITHTTTGAKTLYDKCNDPELTRLQQEADAALEKVKERQKFLASLPATGFNYADPDTGEEFKLYPPVKTGKADISIKY